MFAPLFKLKLKLSSNDNMSQEQKKLQSKLQEQGKDQKEQENSVFVTPQVKEEPNNKYLTPKANNQSQNQKEGDKRENTPHISIFTNSKLDKTDFDQKIKTERVTAKPLSHESKEAMLSLRSLKCEETPQFLRNELEVERAQQMADFSRKSTVGYSTVFRATEDSLLMTGDLELITPRIKTKLEFESKLKEISAKENSIQHCLLEFERKMRLRGEIFSKKSDDEITNLQKKYKTEQKARSSLTSQNLNLCSFSGIADQTSSIDNHRSHSTENRYKDISVSQNGWRFTQRSNSLQAQFNSTYSNGPRIQRQFSKETESRKESLQPSFFEEIHESRSEEISQNQSHIEFFNSMDYGKPTLLFQAINEDCKDSIDHEESLMDRGVFREMTNSFEGASLYDSVDNPPSFQTTDFCERREERQAVKARNYLYQDSRKELETIESVEMLENTEENLLMEEAVNKNSASRIGRLSRGGSGINHQNREIEQEKFELEISKHFFLGLRFNQGSEKNRSLKSTLSLPRLSEYFKELNTKNLGKPPHCLLILILIDVS